MNDDQEQDIHKTLAWCKEQRAHALETISDYERGRRDFRGVSGGPRVDVTDKNKAKYIEIVSHMDKLIAAYEVLLNS